MKTALSHHASSAEWCVTMDTKSVGCLTDEPWAHIHPLSIQGERILCIDLLHRTWLHPSRQFARFTSTHGLPHRHRPTHGSRHRVFHPYRYRVAYAFANPSDDNLAQPPVAPCIPLGARLRGLPPPQDYGHHGPAVTPATPPQYEHKINENNAPNHTHPPVSGTTEQPTGTHPRPNSS